MSKQKILKKKLQNCRSSIKILIFGYHICIADLVLDELCRMELVPKSIFMDTAPGDAEDIVFYLTSKGLVQEKQGCLKVTTEGRIYHQKKGFSGEVFRHFVINAFAVIGSVCAVVSTVLQCIK